MDIKDDVKIGIKSIARAHANNTKVVLGGLATAQIILLAVAAHFAGATFFIPLLFPVAGANLLLIHAVDLKTVKSCLWYFKNSAVLTGGLIASGLFLTYAVEAHNEKEARFKGLKRRTLFSTNNSTYESFTNKPTSTSHRPTADHPQPQEDQA